VRIGRIIVILQTEIVEILSLNKVRAFSPEVTYALAVHSG